MLTIVDLYKADELSSFDMAKVAGGVDFTIATTVISAVYQAVSTLATVGLDGAKAANGAGDPEPDFPGQHGTLQNLRSP
jgi:hypothetical protein